MDFRKYALAAAAALVAFGLYLLWLWQPERQVRLHTSHFLKKVERRNWSGARKMMADDYRDRWEHDRESALEDARAVFQQFLFLTIDNRTDSCEISPDSATTRTVIRISGNGGPIAQLAMERVNMLREPFVLGWRHQSWKPWDWKLTGVDQPELKTDRMPAF